MVDPLRYPWMVWAFVVWSLRIDKGYQGAVAHFGKCVYNNSS